MDISKLSLDEVMQMPDHLFGRRFVVSCTLSLSGSGPAWDISESALPDRAVIWEFSIYHHRHQYNAYYLRLALGDQLPANQAQMDALDPLFPNHGLWVPPRRQFLPHWGQTGGFVNLRNPVTAQGRRLVMEITGTASQLSAMTASIVVSAIPKTIPDWLVPVSDFGLREIIDLIQEGDKPW